MLSNEVVDFLVPIQKWFDFVVIRRNQKLLLNIYLIWLAYSSRWVNLIIKKRIVYWCLIIEVTTDSTGYVLTCILPCNQPVSFIVLEKHNIFFCCIQAICAEFYICLWSFCPFVKCFKIGKWLSNHLMRVRQREVLIWILKRLNFKIGRKLPRIYEFTPLRRILWIWFFGDNLDWPDFDVLRSVNVAGLTLYFLKSLLVYTLNLTQLSLVDYLWRNYNCLSVHYMVGIL